MRKSAVLLVSLVLSSQVFANQVWLSTNDSNMPDPNQEITIDVYTDTPLFIMDLIATLDGDGEMVGAISSADGNDFGWDESGWPCDPYIDPNDPSWINCSGVIWAGTAVGHVGYFKFRYYGGQVTVNVPEYYLYDANCIAVPLANNTLIFGEPDANQALSMQQPNSYLQSQQTGAQGGFISAPAISAEPNRLPRLQRCPSDLAEFTEDPNYMLWANDGLERVSFARDSGSPARAQMLTELDIVDVNSDITANTVWTADKIYRVYESINVEALLVIEPGTTVEFVYDYTAIRVKNGGTLIAVGTPQSMICFKGDWDELEEYYDYGIYVESTASPATRINFCNIQGAYTGIVINNIKLDAPIENNMLLDNYVGIKEIGPKHTDVINNMVFACEHRGIYILMGNGDGNGDPNEIFYVMNNTCDWIADFEEGTGIRVEGLADANNAGAIVVCNNIVSNCFFGFVGLYDFWCYAACNGYYHDIGSTNINQLSPVFIDGEDPFDWHSATSQEEKCRLFSDCAFIDAGTDYIESTRVIGKTVVNSNVPDNNVVDLGFHYPNWDFVNAGTGLAASDLNEDAITDYKDLCTLITNWLADVNSGTNGDLNNDATVNAKDFAEMAKNWQKIQGIGNVVLAMDKDPNNLGGDVQISATVTLANVHDAWLLMDGQFMAGFGSSTDNGPSRTKIKTNSFRNGLHSFKIAYFSDGQISVSPVLECFFNNELSSITQTGRFEPGREYHLQAISDANYTVELKDVVNENSTFTATCSSGINMHIPSSAFTEQYGVYDLTINKQQSQGMQAQLMQGLSVDPPWVEQVFKFAISRKFNRADFPPDVNIRTVISIGNEELETAKVQCWQSAVRAAIFRQMWPVVLRYNDCTWENLQFCLNLNNVKKWYHLAHGHHKLPLHTARQCVDIKGGWFRDKLFSYLHRDRPDAPYILPYEWLCHSVAELGFWNTHKFNWVQFNCCYSAHTTEFPDALGIWHPGDPLGDKIFIGWEDYAYVHDMIDHYNEFEKKLWNKLKAGDNLQYALNEALFGLQGQLQIQENFQVYGVLSIGNVWFRYNDILTSQGW